MPISCTVLSFSSEPPIVCPLVLEDKDLILDLDSPRWNHSQLQTRAIFLKKTFLHPASLGFFCICWKQNLAFFEISPAFGLVGTAGDWL